MWGVPKFKLALVILHKAIRAAESQRCNIANIVGDITWSPWSPAVPDANGR